MQQQAPIASEAHTSETFAQNGKPGKKQFYLFDTARNPIKILITEFIAPLKLFAFPIVDFATFVVSWSASSFLLVNLTQAQAFSVPPYNYSPQSIGLFNLAVVVGFGIGLATAGPISDWISMRSTKRNNGIREPEMRLPTMVPYTLIMILGNLVVGFGYQYDWDWRVCELPWLFILLRYPFLDLSVLESDFDAIFSRPFSRLQYPSTYSALTHYPPQAIVLIGYTCAGIQAAALPAIASTYAIDSYKPVTGSIFVTITVVKNLWGYGMAKFITNWAANDGFLAPVMTNMCLTVLWCACGVGFWRWGKRCRVWTRRSEVHKIAS